MISKTRAFDETGKNNYKPACNEVKQTELFIDKTSRSISENAQIENKLVSSIDQLKNIGEPHEVRQDYIEIANKICEYTVLMINEYTKNEIKGIILELKRLKTEHDKQIYTAVKRINEKKKYMDIMLQNLLGYFNTEYKNQNY